VWDQAIAADGLIAGLRLLKEEGLIQNVSLGMNANADHKVVTPGEGGLETVRIYSLLCSAHAQACLLLVDSRGMESRRLALLIHGGCTVPGYCTVVAADRLGA
jgi:hypothetical protein